MTMQVATFLPFPTSQIQLQPQPSCPGRPALCLHCLGYEPLAGAWRRYILHFRAARPCTCHVFKGRRSRGSVCSTEPMRQQLAIISKFSWLSFHCISAAHSFPPPHPSTASSFSRSINILWFTYIESMLLSDSYWAYGTDVLFQGIYQQL